jgi:hypothetical protein
MACRAPFLPDISLFHQEESQAVYYLQSRFKQISTPKSRSDFTGTLEKSHLVSRSHYSYAFMYASSIKPADIHARVAGWTPVLANARLNANNSFVLPKSKADSLVDKRVVDDSIDLDPLLVAQGKEVLADFERDPANVSLYNADKGKYDQDLVAALINDFVKVTANSFYAAWDAPKSVVPHAALRDWLARKAGSLHSPDVNVDFTTPCCSLCNDIWDVFGRMRQVLSESGIVPLGAVVACRAYSDAAKYGKDVQKIPVSRKARNNKSLHQERLGCLVAYYLHASLSSVCRNSRAPHGPPGADASALNAQDRQVLTALLWIPLHVTCLQMDMVRPISKRVKGQHNYMGCIDLDVAYYLWLLARADRDLKAPFDRFSTFYVKELVECAPPVWDPVQHPRVLDYIFDRGLPASDRVAETVSYVSDRMLRLYTDVVAPLVPLIDGAPFDAGTPQDFCARASAFFIAEPESRALMSSYNDTGDNVLNVRYFLDLAGGAAVLWQMRRYLGNEPDAYHEQLDQWLTAVLVKEWNNMADNSPEEISVAEAQAIYGMQNALDADRITGGGPGLGSGVEVSIARAMDEDALRELLEDCGRCSVWKAARRLRAWQFTRRKPEDIALDLGSSLGSLSLDSGARALVPIHASRDALQSIASFARCLRAYFTPAETPSFDSLRARLISARLERIPAISADGGAWAHGAGPDLDARRRGCRGR